MRITTVYNEILRPLRWLRGKTQDALGITALQSQVRDLQVEVRNLNCRVELVRKVHDLLTADVDLAPTERTRSSVILTGMYRGRGFVQVYDMGEGEFRHLVEQMRDMKRGGYLRNVDHPPTFNASYLL